MIRLQDIAEMAGVSRTTVSNVINGNTKRVSQKTIDKITAILKEQNYVPHMGSVMLSGHGSRIIGVVLGFTYAHGMQSLQDPFVGELIGNIRMETEEKGYYVMLIGGEDIQNVVDIASKWNVEGLIILGYNEEQYRRLSRKLNKKMILIDTYPEGAYTFPNVGVDDYSGGYQIGEYLYSCGYKKALFVAETEQDSDYYRWMGFKQAMEKRGKFCSRSRYIVVPGEKHLRLRKYGELLPRFLEAFFHCFE
jgi:LacI family transcriptional regulator